VVAVVVRNQERSERRRIYLHGGEAALQVAPAETRVHQKAHAVRLNQDGVSTASASQNGDLQSDALAR
jgi:hypothetical protein